MIIAFDADPEMMAARQEVHISFTRTSEELEAMMDFAQAATRKYPALMIFVDKYCGVVGSA